MKRSMRLCVKDGSVNVKAGSDTVGNRAQSVHLTLRKIPPNKAAGFFSDQGAQRALKARNAIAFMATPKVSTLTADPTLSIEIALLRCKRLGVFDKK